jgi:hypothetical protein
MRRQVLLVVGPLAFPMLALLSGCAQPPPPAADAPASSAVHVEASAPAPTTPPPAPTPTPVASAEPPPAAPTASASAAPATPPEAPLPKVKVSNIGMHIGGGPNDDATKEPIKKSVEPHFDAFRRCWGLIGDAQAKGDVGVDLHIGKDGGKAKVDHPRTALKGKPFSECVVSTFEAIDFRKPKTGNTTVSYSLRFSPLRRRNGVRCTFTRTISVRSRTTVSATSEPTGPRSASATSAGEKSRTSWPSMLMISSPSRSPAFAPPSPGATSWTVTRPFFRSWPSTAPIEPTEGAQPSNASATTIPK